MAWKKVKRTCKVESRCDHKLIKSITAPFIICKLLI